MIVGILGPGGCGGTFLDWTLHYLSGNNENLYVCCDIEPRSRTQGVYTQTILDCPITDSTSHLHKKTHPNTDSLDDVIKIFRNIDQKLSTFYYVDSMLPTQTQTFYNTIIKHYPDVNFITYQFEPKHIDLIFWLQYKKIIVPNKNFVNQLSSISNKNFEILSRGEQRELLSLYYPQCIKGQILNEQINVTNNNYQLDFDLVWNSLPDTILEIFNFLNLSVDSTRFDKWIKVYNMWLEKNQFDFFKDLPYIVDSIIVGRLLNLEKYCITLAEEVILASKLLYNHNMALRFEGVSDLSKNTMQWHEILEPNVYHQLNQENKK